MLEGLTVLIYAHKGGVMYVFKRVNVRAEKGKNNNFIVYNHMQSL
jgi:hypothetical protein